MTPIQKLIEAAKDTLCQISGFGSLYDVKEKLRDALKSVESIKPGNRLELVEITEEEAKSGKFDEVYGIIPLNYLCRLFWCEKWTTLFYSGRVFPSTFYRLAHPAEMSEPVNPIEMKRVPDGAFYKFNVSDEGIPTKGFFKSCTMEQASKTHADHDPDAGKWVIHDARDPKYPWKGRDGWKCDLHEVIPFETQITAKEEFCHRDYLAVIPLSEARKIEADRAKKSDPHAGMIQIGNGDWVDPKSETRTYCIIKDLSGINYYPANLRTFDIPSHYFLSEPAAQAFLESERLKAGWAEINGEWVKPEDIIVIGNGEKVKKGTTGLWFASTMIPGVIQDPGLLCKDKDEILNRTYLTQAEAEQRLRDDGFFRTADEKWVSSESTVYTINQNTSLVASFPSYAIDNKFSFYSTPESAAAAWLKLVNKQLQRTPQAEEEK